MQPIDIKIQDAIKKTLGEHGEVVIVAYSLLDKTEQIIRYILHETFQQNGKDDLLDPVFSSIKELTTNAIKANIKQILIDEGIIDNPADPYSVVNGLKSVLNEKSLLEYGIKCKKLGLSMRLHLSVDNDHLIARIIDTGNLTIEQHKRMIDKIERAKGYENLAMCYLENPDPFAEGMGLGLSMVVVLLKGSGIDPDNFSIISNSDRNKTIANITVPLA